MRRDELEVGVDYEAAWSVEKWGDRHQRRSVRPRVRIVSLKTKLGQRVEGDPRYISQPRELPRDRETATIVFEYPDAEYAPHAFSGRPPDDAELEYLALAESVSFRDHVKLKREHVLHRCRPADLLRTWEEAEEERAASKYEREMELAQHRTEREQRDAWWREHVGPLRGIPIDERDARKGVGDLADLVLDHFTGFGGLTVTLRDGSVKALVSEVAGLRQRVTDLEATLLEVENEAADLEAAATMRDEGEGA